ncbi:hypothetical protein [Variovorax rhizosphaerae]|uniref:Uncharacterized protein n=1 Tax=Variovorax rhizosphaerae TaxID=1836200 RepID=A0ABU8WJR1_9BURK
MTSAACAALVRAAVVTGLMIMVVMARARVGRYCRVIVVIMRFRSGYCH